MNLSLQSTVYNLYSQQFVYMVKCWDKMLMYMYVMSLMPIETGRVDPGELTLGTSRLGTTWPAFLWK